MKLNNPHILGNQCLNERSVNTNVDVYPIQSENISIRSCLGQIGSGKLVVMASSWDHRVFKSIAVIYCTNAKHPELSLKLFFKL